jgi:hypothetical protein
MEQVVQQQELLIQEVRDWLAVGGKVGTDQGQTANPGEINATNPTSRFGLEYVGANTPARVAAGHLNQEY